MGLPCRRWMAQESAWRPGPRTGGGSLELAVKYAKERVQFGKPIAKLQGIQWYIADMATKTEAAKWLVYYAASLKDAGKPIRRKQRWQS